MSDHTRQPVIEGLRDLADFLEAHPELPIRLWHPWIYAHGPHGKEASAALTTTLDLLGDDAEIKVSSYDVDVRRHFGPVELIYKATLRDVSEERTVTKAVTERVVPALADRLTVTA